MPEKNLVGSPAPSAAQQLTVVPTPNELESIRGMLRGADAFLQREQQLQIVRWVERGALSTSLGVLDALLERTPHNVSLFRLRRQLHESFVALLEGRLGGEDRQLVAVKDAAAIFHGAYFTILLLAKHPVTVRRVRFVLGHDPLVTLEHIVRMIGVGCLTFVSVPREHRLRSYEQSRVTR